MHIHITSADFIQQPNALVGRAHLLQDVIDLLQLGVDFKKRALGISLGERSELRRLLQEHDATA